MTLSMKAATQGGFDSDAGRYAAYLDTFEGRLRQDLTLANLQEFLPVPAGVEPLHALDLGCGTGAASVCLARLGIEVTLLDSSAMMLDLAERRLREAKQANKATLKEGDAAQLAGVFEAQSFEVIVCHNLLEYVADPGAVLACAARLIRKPPAVLSVVVRNQAGEVLKAALQAGDLAAAERNLAADWGRESLYGGTVRLFTPESLEPMFAGASLTIAARRGVRVIADYLPAEISRTAEYEQVFALESRLGRRQEFFAVARYLQYIARSDP
jgi:S-adenosylmethionine-dependent methyltransferase